MITQKDINREEEVIIEVEAEETTEAEVEEDEELITTVEGTTKRTNQTISSSREKTLSIVKVLLRMISCIRRLELVVILTLKLINLK